MIQAGTDILADGISEELIELAPILIFAAFGIVGGILKKRQQQKQNEENTQRANDDRERLAERRRAALDRQRQLAERAAQQNPGSQGQGGQGQARQGTSPQPAARHEPDARRQGRIEHLRRQQAAVQQQARARQVEPEPIELVSLTAEEPAAASEPVRTNQAQAARTRRVQQQRAAKARAGAAKRRQVVTEQPARGTPLVQTPPGEPTPETPRGALDLTNRSKLQQAIIYHEIFSKPKGLRDHDDF